MDDAKGKVRTFLEYRSSFLYIEVEGDVDPTTQRTQIVPILVRSQVSTGVHVWSTVPIGSKELALGLIALLAKLEPNGELAKQILSEDSLQTSFGRDTLIANFATEERLRDLDIAYARVDEGRMLDVVASVSEGTWKDVLPMLSKSSRSQPKLIDFAGFETLPTSTQLGMPFKIELFGPVVERTKVPELRPVYLESSTAKILEAAIRRRRNIRLVGEPGTGKSTIPMQVAATAGLDYYVYSCSGNTDERQLQGYYILENGNTVLVQSHIVKAVKEGGVLHFDEWALLQPEVKGYLNSLLDFRRELHLTAFDGEVIKAHPDLIVIVSQNPDDGRFGGHQEGNEAIDDRFITVRVNHLPPALEEQMLMDMVPEASVSLVSEVVALANTLRAGYRADQSYLKSPWTPRAMMSLLELVSDGVPLKDAVDCTLVDRIATEDENARMTLLDLATTHISGLNA